ncbi:Leucine-zipper-like transcriptional regulator 1 [Borealophlyctis nickersoniae]|nr:Leucine-zipper-like transcriptional regulator 1 [Borealophlyctis nickersoniae]
MALVKCHDQRAPPTDRTGGVPLVRPQAAQTPKGTVVNICNFRQYEENSKKAFSIYLYAECADDAKRCFDIILRKDLLGPDLDRFLGTKTFSAGQGSGATWSHVGAGLLDINESMVVGVAIYHSNILAARDGEVVVPPTTATSSFFHQAECSTVLHLFTQQTPLLDYAGVFRRLFGDPTRSDVTFVIEEQEVPAHSAVLLSDRAGPYLAALFKEKGDGKVRITGVTHKIFKAILQYIYTGRATVDGVLGLCELYCAADKFQVTTLLPYTKGELLLSLRQTLPMPAILLTLIQQMRAFPGLSDVVRFCVKCILMDWNTAKASESWRGVVTGTEVQEFIEAFLDQAAELYKQAIA